MKKIVSVVLCAVLVMTVPVGCESNGPPKGMSQETYDIGVEALEITDKCLNGEIEKEEAVEKITELCAQLDELASKYFDTRVYVNGINVDPEPDEFSNMR